MLAVERFAQAMHADDGIVLRIPDVGEWGDEGTTSGTAPDVAVTLDPDDVEQMVTVFNLCFARSAYHLDERGQLTVEDDLHAEVYQAVVGRALPS